MRCCVRSYLNIYSLCLKEINGFLKAPLLCDELLSFLTLKPLLRALLIVHEHLLCRHAEQLACLFIHYFLSDGYQDNRQSSHGMRFPGLSSRSKPPSPVTIGKHTVRAAGLTACLENGGAIENAQTITAHEQLREMKLYTRCSD